jgi:uncharacterized BrkB/YihY/UPF0761 family membrane protein
MDLDLNAEVEEPDGPEPGCEADAAALELMKQLITLAAGVLALSATFLEKIGAQPLEFLMVLALSWISLIASVFFGLQTMSVIVKSRINKSDEWSKGRGRTYARNSKFGFLCGITLFAVFAFLLLLNAKSPSVSSPEHQSRPERAATKPRLGRPLPLV